MHVLYIYIYICMYYIYIYIYIYTHVYIYIHTHPHAHTRTHSHRCADEKYRLDHVPTESADDADPKFFSDKRRFSTSGSDKATMTGEGGWVGGGGGSPRSLADDVEASEAADEMLYLYLGP
jgi:hypothetical protein